MQKRILGDDSKQNLHTELNHLIVTNLWVKRPMVKILKRKKGLWSRPSFGSTWRMFGLDELFYIKVHEHGFDTSELLIPIIRATSSIKGSARSRQVSQRVGQNTICFGFSFAFVSLVQLSLCFSYTVPYSFFSFLFPMNFFSITVQEKEKKREVGQNIICVW